MKTEQTKRPIRRKMTCNSPIVQAKLKIILAMLEDNSMTLRELAEQSRISTTSIKHYLLHLHKERVIYISHHVKAGFTSAPVYAVGDKADAIKFVPSRDWAAAWIPTRGAA